MKEQFEKEFFEKIKNYDFRPISSRLENNAIWSIEASISNDKIESLVSVSMFHIEIHKLIFKEIGIMGWDINEDYSVNFDEKLGECYEIIRLYIERAVIQKTLNAFLNSSTDNACKLWEAERKMQK